MCLVQTHSMPCTTVRAYTYLQGGVLSGLGYQRERDDYLFIPHHPSVWVTGCKDTRVCGDRETVEEGTKRKEEGEEEGEEEEEEKKKESTSYKNEQKMLDCRD